MDSGSKALHNSHPNAAGRAPTFSLGIYPSAEIHIAMPLRMMVEAGVEVEMRLGGKLEEEVRVAAEEVLE